MERMDAERVFLDTNVLVFAASLTAPLHRQARTEIQRLRSAGHPLWISRQVLREYLAVLSRPQTFSRAKPARELTGDIRYFLDHFEIAEESSTVTARLLDLVEEKEVGGKQIHDANIVATMLAFGIPALLTDNGADFARYADLIQVRPLASG